MQTTAGSGVVVELPALTRVVDLKVLDNLSGTWDLALPLLTSLEDLSVSLGSGGRLSLPLVEEASFVQVFGYLDAPNLREVGQLHAQIQLSAASDVLPALESADIALALDLRGSSTATASLPSLARATDFGITGAGARVVLPALADVNKLSISSMPELESIDMPNVRTLERLGLTDNPKLLECDVNDLIAQTQPSTTTIYNNGPPCP